MPADAPILIVGIGDIKIGKSPVKIRTHLGSCIGICLYSPQAKVGGMLHCMFPIAEDKKNRPGFRNARYADTGIEELVLELKKAYGVEPRELQAKIFGGASMLKNISSNIGQQNEESSRATLKALMIPVISSKTGGAKGYQIDFNLENGAVACRVFGEEPQEL